MGGVKHILAFVVVWVIFILVTMGFGLLLIPVYYWFTFVGADARADKARQKLNSALMKGETITAQGLQKRPFALLARRQIVAITSSRLILVQRSILGGFSMKDHQWKDLHDALLSENIFPSFFGSKLSFISNRAGFQIDGIPSETAALIYSHAQAQEQEWEEKNRVRSLEEKRASSGGAFVNVGATPNTSSGVDEIFDKLQKAKALFDSGAINDSEYQELKSKILSKSAGQI